MYSSLFAAGLAQCWEAESPAASPPPASTAFVATHKPHLSAASTASAPTTSTSSYPSSFFAFDSSSKPSKRPSARKDAAVASEASMLASEFQDYTRARSPSPSRLSMDSVVTLPTRSGTYRSRSGARRRPRQPTVFSTTTSAAASSFFASSDEFEDAIHPRSYSSRRTHVASSTEPSAPPPVPMLPSSQAFLVRRRSLPSAKPAPSSHLPTLPTSSPGASSSRVQRGRNPQPATSRKDPHISFVPTESSSGSSSNTVLFNATQSYLLSPLSTTAQSKGKAPSAANYLTTTEMSSTNSNEDGNGSPVSRTRSSSPWTLPPIQTNDFRLSALSLVSSPTQPSSDQASIPPRSFTPSLASSSTSSNSHPSSSKPGVSSRPIIPPIQSAPDFHNNPNNTGISSPISPSSSAHSLRSVQSLQSMLESTSSTSTVTFDELSEHLPPLSSLHHQTSFPTSPISPSSSPMASRSTSRSALEMAEELQGIRLSGFDDSDPEAADASSSSIAIGGFGGLDFSLEDAFRMGLFEVGIGMNGARNEESGMDDGAASAFPMSVRGSLASVLELDEETSGKETRARSGKSREASVKSRSSGGHRVPNMPLHEQVPPPLPVKLEVQPPPVPPVPATGLSASMARSSSKLSAAEEVKARALGLNGSRTASSSASFSSSSSSSSSLPRSNQLQAPAPATSKAMLASFSIGVADIRGLNAIPTPGPQQNVFGVDLSGFDVDDTESMSFSLLGREALMSPSSISLPNPPTDAAEQEASSSTPTHRFRNQMPPNNARHSVMTTSTAHTIKANQRRASTIASSTYRRTKRSDALAQLEGRAFTEGFQFAPPHLNARQRGRYNAAEARVRAATEESFLPLSDGEGEPMSTFFDDSSSKSGGTRGASGLNSPSSSKFSMTPVEPLSSRRKDKKGKRETRADEPKAAFKHTRALPSLELLLDAADADEESEITGKTSLEILASESIVSSPSDEDEAGPASSGLLHPFLQPQPSPRPSFHSHLHPHPSPRPYLSPSPMYALPFPSPSPSPYLGPSLSTSSLHLPPPPSGALPMLPQHSQHSVSRSSAGSSYSFLTSASNSRHILPSTPAPITMSTTSFDSASTGLVSFIDSDEENSHVPDGKRWRGGRPSMEEREKGKEKEKDRSRSEKKDKMLKKKDKSMLNCNSNSGSAGPAPTANPRRHGGGLMTGGASGSVSSFIDFR